MPLYSRYCGSKVACKLLLFKTCAPAFMNNFSNLAAANNQQNEKPDHYGSMAVAF